MRSTHNQKAKLLLLLAIMLGVAGMANAQKSTTKVIDNKGTIKWVLDSSTQFVDTGYNGLSMPNGHSVVLGGKLVQVTTLDVNGQKLQISNLISGLGTDSLVVADPTTGELKRISSSRLLGNLTAKNGMYKQGDSIKLGGALTETTTITTSATNTLKIAGLQSGSGSDSIMVVDPATNSLRYISKSKLFGGLFANNGLTKSGDSIQLGGTLTKPTTITTSATNTLALPGLQGGSTTTDSMLVVNGATGVLRQVSVNSLLQSGEQTFTAAAGQSNYSVANMPATASKVWVYRNGAKLVAATDFNTAAGVMTLTTAMAALVAVNDVIEVQWVK